MVVGSLSYFSFLLVLAHAGILVLTTQLADTPISTADTSSICFGFMVLDCVVDVLRNVYITQHTQQHSKAVSGIKEIVAISHPFIFIMSM
jgi:hypothetical protein